MLRMIGYAILAGAFVGFIAAITYVLNRRAPGRKQKTRVWFDL